MVKDVGGGHPEITASIVRVDGAQHQVGLLGGVILQQGGVAKKDSICSMAQSPSTSEGPA
ncbi:hypothetical protein SynPROSU1_02075 [Synechococcus sp. PROS-U-1]|nr:hypothetical protein SynPROSU1_02075 [Synechococcus sp. PROS-U-1]